MSFKDRRRKWKRQFQQQFSNFLEIPKDIMLDLPKVVLVGNIQVFVENHMGIIEYGDEIIRVKVNEGEIAIRGEKLVLRNILPDEISVEGKIISVNYQ